MKPKQTGINQPSRTFTADFGKGVRCTVKVPNTVPAKGKYQPVMEWEGTPTKKVLRPYIAWMNSVNAQLANEWGVKLMQCYLTGKESAEVWVYEPGKPPAIQHA